MPFALESNGRRRQSLARGHSLNEADGDFSGRLTASRKQDGREYTSESGPKGWRGLLEQRTPPLRAARSGAAWVAGKGGGPRRGVYGALARRLTAKALRRMQYWPNIQVVLEG